MRGRGLLIATMAVAWLVVGCSDTRLNDEVGNEDVEGAEHEVLDVVALVADVDEVVEMLPGGFAEPLSVWGPETRILQSRHVLRAITHEGPVDLFDMVIIEDDGLSGPQRCMALSTSDVLSVSCAPLQERRRADDGQQPLLRGATGSDTMTILELVGPEGTTHFVVVVGQRRIGLIAIEGRALLSTRAEFCQAPPDRVEAWDGNRLLRTEDNQDLCR